MSSLATHIRYYQILSDVAGMSPFWCQMFCPKVASPPASCVSEPLHYIPVLPVWAVHLARLSLLYFLLFYILDLARAVHLARVSLFLFFTWRGLFTWRGCRCFTFFLYIFGEGRSLGEAVGVAALLFLYLARAVHLARVSLL